MKILPAATKARIAAMASRYTLEHCEALLRQDPGATLALFEISQNRAPGQHHKKKEKALAKAVGLR